MRMYRWRATLTASGEYERLKKLKERSRKRELYRNFTIEKQEWSSMWIGWIDLMWIAKREDRRSNRRKFKKAASKS
ncbi:MULTISPECIES: hypothetical protein [Bacillus cereus group]|uniref:hypothetical protein n=1 Tax=Bacillus cereus group TaxID=86661 RepID=UPI00124CFD9C|nr:hypothetical protein [Bacillus cereus]KAB2419314.1 hypothetical protein F8167_29550 [Bacillus cereus]